MGANIEAWNYVTVCQILASSWMLPFDTVTTTPPGVILVIEYGLLQSL